VSTEPSTINVLALVGDLIFESKIRGAARGSLATVHAVRTRGDLLASAGRLAPRLVLVDLNVLPACTADSIAELRHAAGGARIIGFASHVDTELMDRAEAAGADEVMPRSRFEAEIVELLQGVAEQSAGRAKPGGGSPT